MKQSDSIARTIPQAYKDYSFSTPNVLRCPSCGSTEVHPSARHGVFENVVLRVKFMRPFLCYSCAHRFYDFTST
jgi:hypothetical protein